MIRDTGRPLREEAPFGGPPALARLTLGWLGLALGALLLSSLFAALLVAARVPALAALLPHTDFFRSALVLHVNLSVLVWFMAFAGALWSLLGGRRWHPLGWASLGACAAGTLMMASTPFRSGAPAVLANYVPVIHEPGFLGELRTGGHTNAEDDHVVSAGFRKVLE